MEGQKLAVEVGLLRKLCRSLDGQRKRSHQEAVEWQNFGQFTAEVLQKEAGSYERKLLLLQERLDGLARENGELREMCLYLDKSRDASISVGGSSGGESIKPREGDRPSSFKAPVHSMCAEEMNRDPGPTLRYAGITSDNTLRDKSKILGIHGTRDPQAAVTVLQKRLERVESEKLELVKSLSAAHLLTAQQNYGPSVRPKNKATLSPPLSVQDPTLPPEFRTLLESCRNGKEQSNSSAPSVGLSVSADMIMQAVTLLDMCRRLDALEESGLTDPVEKKEVAILRLLMSIAWQKLQEESKPK